MPKYFQIDPRKFLPEEINCPTKTIDVDIQTILHLQSMQRNFIIQYYHFRQGAFIDESESLRNMIFKKYYKTQPTYSIYINNAILSPATIINQRKNRIICGRDHYFWNILHSKMKNSQGTIRYSTEDSSFSFQNYIKPTRYSGEYIYLNLFSNFFHMLYEIFPSFLALKDYGFDLSKSLFLCDFSDIPDNSDNSYIYSYIPIFQFFQIRFDQLITASPEWMFCDKLIVPSFQTFGHIQTPTVYADRLGKFLSAHAQYAPVKTHKKLFISRKLAKYRKIANEDELASMLALHGYVAIDPGELSKLEQIALFEKAEYIIACHGMGLAAFIASSNPVILVEIFASSWIRNYYYNPAQAKSCAYASYIIDDINENRDIICDIGVFKLFIDEISLKFNIDIL